MTRQIEITGSGKLWVPDEWGDVEVKQNIKELKSRPVIEIDYGTESSPIVRGDLANILPVLQKHTHAEWGKDEWWHVQPRDVETIRQMAEQLSFRLVELLPKSPPKPPAEQGRREKPDQTTTEPSSAPVAVKGVVMRVNHCTTTNGKYMAYVTLLVNKKKYDFSSWSKTINDYLEKGKGKQAVVTVETKGKYRNIVALKAIGSQEFDEDGLPIIQQKNREAGKPTLWNP